MVPITEMTGVVLAGGESRRMGRDKAWLDYGGRPLIRHQTEKLAGVFREVRISAKASAPFSAVPYRVIEDGSEVSAPLVGIAASLRALGRPIFALGVDLPQFPPGLVERVARRLLDGSAPCAVLRAGEKIQGLCGAYRPSVLPVYERNAAEGRLAIFDLVSECGGEILGEEFWGPVAGPEAFANWNRPEDVATALR